MTHLIALALALADERVRLTRSGPGCHPESGAMRRHPAPDMSRVGRLR